MRRWAVALGTRKHMNVATRAITNKIARIAWAVLRSGNDFDPRYRSSVA